MKTLIYSILTVALLASIADAGPFRGRRRARRATCNSGNCGTPRTQGSAGPVAAANYGSPQALAEAEVNYMASTGQAGHFLARGNALLRVGARFAGTGYAGANTPHNQIPTCTTRGRPIADAVQCSGGRCYRCRLW